MNLPGLSRVTWKTARYAANQTCFGFPIIPIPKNSRSLPSLSNPAVSWRVRGRSPSSDYVVGSKTRVIVRRRCVVRPQDYVAKESRGYVNLRRVHGANGFSQHGHYAIRTRWLPSYTHVGSRAWNRGSLAIHLRHHWGRPADAGRRQHHVADQPL